MTLLAQESPFVKVHPCNFTPVNRTPWAGSEIARIKLRYLQELSESIPSRIGESWEISTSEPLVSQVVMPENNRHKALTQIFGERGNALLGNASIGHNSLASPVLLKWIHAAETLSVQVHPRDDHPALLPNQCGKSEAWLVAGVEPGGHIYLGFKDGISRHEIEAAARADDLARCLHRVEPKEFDLISIPAGCVHALGPGVLVIEPQTSLPGRESQTWRLSDWGRLFDSNGLPSPNGKPRQLHLESGLSAVDWTIPQGGLLEEKLVSKMRHAVPLQPSAFSPFFSLLICEPGLDILSYPFGSRYTLVTMWAGRARLRAPNVSEVLELAGGESAIIAAGTSSLQVETESQNGEKPALALFVLA